MNLAIVLKAALASAENTAEKGSVGRMGTKKMKDWLRGRS